MSSGSTGAHVTGIGHGILANLACSVASAGCVAVGIAKSSDMNDPKNWKSLAALLIVFGGIAFIGTGANGTRLWLKRRAIGRAPGEKLTVVIAELIGDDANRTQMLNVRDSLVHYLGPCIDLVTYPIAFASADGLVANDFAKHQAAAQDLLAKMHGDLLIWGRVKSSEVVALNFTGRSTGTSKVEPYDLSKNTERRLELPKNFDTDLGAALAARVVSVGDALLGREGDFLKPYATKFAAQIEPLAAHPKPNWTSDSRGDVMHAYAHAIFLVGRESGDHAPLVAAYRAALQEWTRERVPLDWATTQNNLGSALATLGERESGTVRLEEAVAAYRAALEERTRERVPLDWAMTQMNLANALATLGERESGTARLEEAVAAYRAALQEWTREATPHSHGIAQANVAECLAILEQRRKE
jgi:exonuclease VII small subunit